MAGFPRMRALPGVPVAHTHAVQELTATPKAHAGRVGNSIEVTGQHHLQAALTDALLNEPIRTFELTQEVDGEHSLEDP